MRRIALYAHFDAADAVRPYVRHALSALRKRCDEVVFVSTSRLSREVLESLAPTCSVAFTRENVGMDFAMWRDALDRISLDGADELVLANSSVFGPFGDLLERAFASMDAVDCDFWGMTENLEIAWHVMSYFLVLRRPTIEGGAVQTFFRHVLPMRTKPQVIRSYEVGLSSWLTEQGMRAAVLVPLATMRPLPLVHRVLWQMRPNATVFYADELLARGMPFVKVEALRDDVEGLDRAALRRSMAGLGWDDAWVEFDRPGRVIRRPRR